MVFKLSLNVQYLHHIPSTATVRPRPQYFYFDIRFVSATVAVATFVPQRFDSSAGHCMNDDSKISFVANHPTRPSLLVRIPRKAADAVCAGQLFVLLSMRWNLASAMVVVISRRIIKGKFIKLFKFKLKILLTFSLELQVGVVEEAGIFLLVFSIGEDVREFVLLPDFSLTLLLLIAPFSSTCSVVLSSLLLLLALFVVAGVMRLLSAKREKQK